MKKTLVIGGIIAAIVVGIGIAFALVSNSDEAKIRELIFAYQISK